LEPKTKTGFRKSALILKFGQIGDVIMAIPAVYALYQQGFDIEWVSGKATRSLLESYTWIKVIPVDDKAILLGGLGKRISNIARLWRRLCPRKYDLCATLYYDRRFHLLALPIRARKKVALCRESRASALLPGRHHADEYSRVLLETADACKEESVLPVRPDCLMPSPLPAGKFPRRIAIVPGGASNVLTQQIVRRWPIENYVGLARDLLNRGWEVVLLGGADDNWVKPYFSDLTVTDCIGTLSLPEVISVCDTCDGVVSHDTGPLHLAGLSQASLVGIFGPTDPSSFLPRRPFVVGIWGGQGFACRPCYDGRNFAPCHFNGCMHQVSPELVLRELDRLLTARSQQTPVPWGVVFPGVTSQMTANSELISFTAHKP